MKIAWLDRPDPTQEESAQRSTLEWIDSDSLKSRLTVWLLPFLLSQLLVATMLTFGGGFRNLSLETAILAFITATVMSALGAVAVILFEKKFPVTGSLKNILVGYLFFTLAITVGAWVIRSISGYATHGLIAFAEIIFVGLVFAGIIQYCVHAQQQARYFKKEAALSRMQELQSRMRPHFLFNSMNIIASLVSSDPEKAEQVVVDLSELFRRVLDDTRALVPLRDELTLCRSYLALEKLRLGERLQTEWEIADYGEGVLIPSLTLQPVVENAVYHGIQLLTEGGKIHISVKREDGRILLTVANPRSQRMHHNKGSKMAIDNVQRRLAAHFGPSAVVRADRMTDHYTTYIDFPVEESR